MLLNILQRTGQPPRTKNIWTQSVNSLEIEKPHLKDSVYRPKFTSRLEKFLLCPCRLLLDLLLIFSFCAELRHYILHVGLCLLGSTGHCSKMLVPMSCWPEMILTTIPVPGDNGNASVYSLVFQFVSDPLYLP